MLTREQIEQSLPSNLRSAATQQFTDMVNNIAADPDVAENIRENFLSYTKVLQEGRFKSEDYLHAVAYVSYKHMGYSNTDAWSRTFPARHTRLVANGVTPKDISAHVAAFHKNKLVNLIMEQSLIPVWIINQENFQKAINTQVEIMEDGSLPAVARTAAANSLLTHLAKPKEAAASVTLNIGETAGMKELRGMLTQLAEQQRQAITDGASTKEIAGQRIFDAVVVEEQSS